MVQEAGGFLTAWRCVARNTPLYSALQAPPGAEASLQGDPYGEPCLSDDVRAEASERFWRRGGTVVLWFRVAQSGPRRLALGLPAGASVRLDGVPLVEGASSRPLPDALEVPVELVAGDHRLTITVPSLRARWHGRGFYARWLTPGGRPDRSLVILQPPLDLSDLSKGGALSAELALVDPAIQSLVPVSPSARRSPMPLDAPPQWRASVRVGVSLPAKLVGRPLRLRVRAERGGAAPGGELEDECALSPGVECVVTLLWAAEAAPGGRLGPVALEARLEDQGPWVRLARWGEDGVSSELTAQDLSLGRRLRARLVQGSWPRSSLETMALDLQRLRDALVERPLSPPIKARPLRRRLSRHVSALEAGRDPVAQAQGLHLRAYRSPYDHRLQPYALYVPSRLDRTKPTPLVVGLHGYRGKSMPFCRTVLGGAAPRMLVVCPYGYADTVYRFVGEDDLFRVMAQVESDFKVDSERVYLTGVSNGGLAAYEVVLHHPDKWAAVAVLAALGDIRDFSRIGRDGHAPYETQWIDRVSSAERVVNARHMDFLIVYGERDRLDHRSVEKLSFKLRGAGARVRYVIHDDLGHNVWDRTYEDGAIFKWFQRRRLRRKPGHLVYLSRSPRYRGADGLVMEDAEWSAGAFVEARWSSPEALTVKAEHVRRFHIPARAGEAPREVQVTLDGVSTRVTVSPGDGRLIFELGEVSDVQASGGEEARWRVSTDAAPPTRSEWPWPQGRPAARDFYGGVDQLRGGAQLYVYGTEVPWEVSLNRHLARLDRRRWARNVRMDARVVADAEVTLDDLRRHHLVLVGTNEANPWLGRLVPGVMFKIGAHGQAPTPVGLRAIVPNPVSPGLGVVLSTGTTARGVSIATGLPEVLPDSVWAGPDALVKPFDILMRDRPLLAWE